MSDGELKLPASSQTYEFNEPSEPSAIEAVKTKGVSIYIRIVSKLVELSIKYWGFIGPTLLPKKQVIGNGGFEFGTMARFIELDESWRAVRTKIPGPDKKIQIHHCIEYFPTQNTLVIQKHI